MSLPYFAAFQFNDYVRQEVKYAAASRKTVDVLRADILAKAKELGIPLTKNDIRITKRGPSFTLDVEYRWPIDLKVYKHDLTSTFRRRESCSRMLPIERGLEIVMSTAQAKATRGLDACRIRAASRLDAPHSARRCLLDADSPRFDKAIRDGFAVRFEDVRQVPAV